MGNTIKWNLAQVYFLGPIYTGLSDTPKPLMTLTWLG